VTVFSILLRNKVILLAILLFSCSAYSTAQDSIVSSRQVKFDIDGVKLGDKLKESFFSKYCPSIPSDSDEIECKNNIELDGIKLSIVYFFYKSRLLAVTINYPSLKYDNLIKTYTTKFSQSPHNNQEESILLSTGVEYKNEKSSWNTISGKFVIEKYGNSLQKGVAYLFSREYERYKIKKTEEIQRSDQSFLKIIFGNIFD
jgi:hypothetical protein